MMAGYLRVQGPWTKNLSMYRVNPSMGGFHTRCSAYKTAKGLTTRVFDDY